MKFKLENFLELDTTQLLAVNGGSGCGGSSGGGSSGGSSSGSSSSSGGSSSGGGSSSSGGGSCGGKNTINTGISIPNGYDLPSISDKGKKQPISIDSEGVTLNVKEGVGITIDVDVTGGYTAGNESFGIDVYPVGIDVKTPVGTFSGELESVTVKVKVDY